VSSALPLSPVTLRVSTCSSLESSPLPLVVVPTPIGNLEDITLRALRYLREADLVACEDTRRTGRLLAHYEIKKPLLSYHEHNEERLAPELAERAHAETVALVSDAGTPLVSDPGYRLLRACVEAGVEVEVLPGPSAVMTALVASGLPTDTVVFLSFPPRKGHERKEIFGRVAREKATFVFFESPRRLGKTLEELPREALVAVCRELTKLHEEVFRGTVGEAAGRYVEGARGEIVLVVRGGMVEEVPDFEEVVERARGYVAQGESPSRAAARAAKEWGWKRGEVYDRLVGS
jgi:16S rRNA (cytidine1402-2'-O)-methyltransferase